MKLVLGPSELSAQNRFPAWETMEKDLARQQVPTWAAGPAKGKTPRQGLAYLACGRHKSVSVALQPFTQFRPPLRVPAWDCSRVDTCVEARQGWSLAPRVHCKVYVLSNLSKSSDRAKGLTCIMPSGWDGTSRGDGNEPFRPSSQLGG